MSEDRLNICKSHLPDNVPLLTLLAVAANHGVRVARLITFTRNVVLGSINSVNEKRFLLFEAFISSESQGYLPAVAAGTRSSLSLVGAILRKVADWIHISISFINGQGFWNLGSYLHCSDGTQYRLQIVARGSHERRVPRL